MICGCPRAALGAAAAVLVSFGSASAQQPTVTVPDQSKPPSGRPTTVVTGQQPRRADESRIVPQGFSVVLVLADLTASTAQDDVPPAARRALADMKDFLPYKSYKLLDAAWVLGQGQQTIRLRGPEEQEYELRLITPGSATVSGRLHLQFSLREASPHASEVEYARSAQEAALRAEIATAERSEVVRSRRRGTAQELARLENELRQARVKADQTKVQAIEKEIAVTRDLIALQNNVRRKITSSRAIIDTSFTMEVGETVVVGTSRLRGNSKALIALLTAVPPRGANSRNEVR